MNKEKNERQNKEMRKYEASGKVNASLKNKKLRVSGQGDAACLSWGWKVETLMAPQALSHCNKEMFAGQLIILKSSIFW